MQALLLTLSLLLTFTAQGSGQQVKLDFNHDPKTQNYGQAQLDLPFAIDAIVLPKHIKWQQILALYVGDKAPSRASYPSIAGSYTLHQGNLLFTPRFAPVPDQSYTLVFNAKVLAKLLPGQDKLAKASYQLTRYVAPVKFAKTTKVLRILPLTATVPQNVLRFYLHFSAPMSFDNPYHYLSILDEQDQVVENAFVEFSEGLWDRQRKRLTVFIHPGRIKRGVGPNVKQGMVFQPGHNYSLKLDKDFKDFRGVELSADFYKDIKVSAPVFEKIDPGSWQLGLPKSNSLQALEIIPERALDSALALRMITVIDAATQTEIQGSMAFDEQGIKLRFRPAQRWQAGSYQLSIEQRLEDLAGNTLGWAFDSETPINSQTGEVVEHLVPFKLDHSD